MKYEHRIINFIFFHLFALKRKISFKGIRLKTVTMNNKKKFRSTRRVENENQISSFPLS